MPKQCKTGIAKKKNCIALFTDEMVKKRVVPHIEVKVINP